MTVSTLSIIELLFRACESLIITLRLLDMIIEIMTTFVGMQLGPRDRTGREEQRDARFGLATLVYEVRGHVCYCGIHHSVLKRIFRFLKPLTIEYSITIMFWFTLFIKGKPGFIFHGFEKSRLICKPMIM